MMYLKKTGFEASRKEGKHKKDISVVRRRREGVRAQVLFMYVCSAVLLLLLLHTTTDGVFSVLRGRRRSGCEALEDSDHSSLKLWALWFSPYYT